MLQVHWVGINHCHQNCLWQNSVFRLAHQKGEIQPCDWLLNPHNLESQIEDKNLYETASAFYANHRAGLFLFPVVHG